MIMIMPDIPMSMNRRRWMNYIRLYIKRTFTNNFKKQVFLIFGIAAFVAMLSSEVMKADADEWGYVSDLKRYDMDFSAKVPTVSMEEIAFMESHAEVTRVETIEISEVLAGPSGVEFLTTYNVPDAWKLKYLYGKVPGPGEIVLTDGATIGKRQPEPGEVIRIKVRVGEEEKQVDVTVSGVIKGVEDYTSGYAFLNAEDFVKLTEGLEEEERCFDAFVQTIYEDCLRESVWGEMYVKFGTDNIGSISPEIIYVEYDVRGVVLRAMRVIVLFGACLATIIYMILQDDKKIIGIFRALGASKSQITAMVTTRILSSGAIGAVVGFLFVILVEYVENLLTYTDTGSIDSIGWPSLLVVPVAGFVALVLLHLPVLRYLLKESPVSLMKDTVHAGKGLVRMNGTKVFRVKHPIWWYAGLEGKRLRERQMGLVIISMVALFLASETCLQFQVRRKEASQEAKEITYTVRKEAGSFTEAELEKLSGLQGLQIETLTEETAELLQEFAVQLYSEYETVAALVEDVVPGAKLVEDKLYVGNTEEELNRDTTIAVVADVIVALLTAVSFLFCYYSFYYLEKTEEYRKLYAMGASRSMIRKAMLSQALRSSVVIALGNGILSYVVYRWKISQYTYSWLKEDVVLFPIAEMLVFGVLVIGVSMGATWFASKQVLDVLGQTAFVGKEKKQKGAGGEILREKICQY